MSVDEKIGQLLFTTYHGSLTPTDAAAYAQIMHDVNDLHCGGFINITQGVAAGHREEPGVSDRGANESTASEIEAAAADRRRFRTRRGHAAGRRHVVPHRDGAWPPAGNPADAYTMGKVTALEARAVGIQWIYAPDADVNNNPGNPIINTRSFGEDPARVAEYVTAFVRGVEENGGLATAKHFPGHGDTASDSHIDLPVIHADRERLDELELVPFRAAISAGVGSIMTGHLSVPSLEPDPEYARDAFLAHS